ncbi:phosphatidylglycerol lysyltransferase domain-containing protein [Tsukamurella sp. 8F]|uniref:phosphatidylglycerol lysyltransferase domain-containing protein n=1 Tax=unclassified Tsukamurella TaxID=2633480 RepID=UPI0023B8C29C|nr:MULTISPECIES: phosphatidylglycerol lysyltransferase domain-containing protein [unclassified Tsukamurella]MDF0529892.1 phosphatidylglycerol lysyltransferase domain-containing protein [Tsukamurella sp. 8J]MDF0588653.1 phosphatidylglycerol lysyltransferase domain-containing protein [Tsukamurella sp. 8F]
MSDENRERVRELVAGTEQDPLAPFALRPEREYALSPDHAAAIGFVRRLGVVVVGGDPVGDTDSWPAAIDELERLAGRHPVAVLGAGERAVPLWQRRGLKGIPIGRDVVIATGGFDLVGRKYRNVRQGIQRSRNAGVTVDVYREGELPDDVVGALRAMERRLGRDPSRGFSMILGRMFDGSAPNAVVAVAGDAGGRVIAAHRYLPAGPDLSLDLPLREPGAGNGVDERLVAEVVEWGRQNGVKRVSLAFAPFPDLFAVKDGSLPVRAAQRAVHVFDPVIHVERLYRYLRKFHAFGQQRYVMLKPAQILWAATAFILLELGSYSRRSRAIARTRGIRA